MAVPTIIILGISSWIAKVGPQVVDGDSLPIADRERMEIVRKTLSEVPLIDGHNDLPWNIRSFVHNQLQSFDFDKDLRQTLPWSKSSWSQTDLLRLRQGMVGGQVCTKTNSKKFYKYFQQKPTSIFCFKFWAAYVPCDSQYLNAVQLTLEQVDLIKRLIEKYSTHMQFATSEQGATTNRN